MLKLHVRGTGIATRKSRILAWIHDVGASFAHMGHLIGMDVREQAAPNGEMQ
jgi:hypothetical protein